MEMNSRKTEKIFTDQVGATSFALQHLSKKYGTRFNIDDYYAVSHGIYGSCETYMFVTNCIEGENEGKTCMIWVSDLGEEMDDFAANFVKAHAEKPFNDLLEAFPGILEYKTEFFGTRTSASLPRDISLSEYLEKATTATVSCSVKLDGGLEVGSYAEKVHALIESLFTISLPFELRVIADDITIFVYRFPKGQSRWTIDTLRDEIQSNICAYKRRSIL